MARVLDVTLAQPLQHRLPLAAKEGFKLRSETDEVVHNDITISLLVHHKHM